MHIVEHWNMVIIWLFFKPIFNQPNVFTVFQRTNEPIVDDSDLASNQRIYPLFD